MYMLRMPGIESRSVVQSARSLFVLSLAVGMLVGCGSVGNLATNPTTTTTTTTTLPLADSWQFSLVPASSAVPLVDDSIEAVLHTTTSEIVGTAHTIGFQYGNADPCYNVEQNIPLSGTIDAGGNISVASAPVAGQVLTFSGILASDGASISSGDYTFKGGCADGQRGLLTGLKFKPVSGTYSGMLTSSITSFGVSADLTQSSGATGFFGVDGTVTYASPTCSKEFTITASQLAGRFIQLFLAAKDGMRTTVYGSVDSQATQIHLEDDDGVCGGGGEAVLNRE